MIPILSDSLLDDYLQCHSKSYLRFQGRLTQASSYSNLCAQLDARHRAKKFQWLAAKSRTAGARCFNGSRSGSLATGYAMILDAVGRAEGLETHFHGLQRVPGDSGLGAYHYEPIRICRHVRPSSGVCLLLAFDALILGHLQGLLPERGALICGPTFRRTRVQLRTHLGSLV
jgi:predicted RecB family nuclease